MWCYVAVVPLKARKDLRQSLGLGWFSTTTATTTTTTTPTPTTTTTTPTCVTILRYLLPVLVTHG